MDDESRIDELNRKATQLLTFLSFAPVAAILLETPQGRVLTHSQRVAVNWSLRFWALSLFPTLLIVLPVKECCGDEPIWYKHLRRAKAALLSIAIFLIIPGAVAFLCAIW